MRKSSTGRSSSVNPVRLSAFEREEKSAGRSDARRTQTVKPKGPVDNSLIPRPRIRSSSSERASIRRSNLKVTAKTPLNAHHGVPRISSTTPITPRVSSNRLYTPSSASTRHRSPSAERASCFGAKGPRKDTRPLTDKSHQSRMLAKIDQYFYSIQQVQLLNPSGSLRPITLKIFIESTGCLLRLLDIKHDIGINNYVDELPKMVKKVHYPGTVTKSWLKTANTMHSWPHVLGWLSWLVELCEAKDIAAINFQIEKLPFLNVNDEEDTNRERFLATLKFYSAWNEDNPEEEAALVEQYIQKFGNKYGDIEMAMEEERQNLEMERASMEVMDEQGAESDLEINKLRAILEGLKREESEKINYITSSESVAQSAVVEIARFVDKSELLEQEIQKQSVVQAELERLVVEQPMSIIERDRIMKETSEIQEYIKQFGPHIQDIEQELYTMELKFANAKQNLYKAVLAYNKDMIMHFGSEMGADLESLKMPETNMLDDDYMDILRSKEDAMLHVKEQITREIGQMESSIEAKNNELENLMEKLNALRRDHENRAKMMTEQKLSVQQIQRRAKENEVRLKEQIKSLNDDIEKLRCSMPDLDYAANELAEANDKYAAVLRRKQHVEKEGEKFFSQFYQILAAHRNEISRLIKKFPNT